MIRISSYPILLCLGVIAAASDSEAYYVIRTSESQFESCADRYSSAACEDNDLTLSQFVDNSSNYLTDDTTLMFSPGSYSLESELIVENIHSFILHVCMACLFIKGYHQL